MKARSPSARALGGALLAALVAGCGAASPSASELPSSALDPGPCATERASCPAGQACGEDAAGAYLSCVEGSVRSLADAGKPVAAFDRAAVALLDPTLDAAAGERDALLRVAAGLARAALDDLEEVAADDRWDLAARKAAFACAPWYRLGRICPVDDDVARYVGGARRFHQTKANELRGHWPAAAALHACLGASADCPKELLAAADQWSILTKAAYEVKLGTTAKGCEGVAAALTLPSSKKLGAARELAFELVLQGCGVAKDETKSAPVDGACYFPPGTKRGDKVGFGEAELVATEKVVMQKAKRTDMKRVVEATALLRVEGAPPNAKSPPILARVEQTAYRVESDNCDRTSAWAPDAPDAAYAKQITEALPALVERELAVSVEDHVARAEKERAGGNFAAADHFHVLAALGRMKAAGEGAEVPPATVAWFEERFGAHGGLPNCAEEATLVESSVGVTYSWPDIRKGGVQAGRVSGQ